jgi:hypothetical protein
MTLTFKNPRAERTGRELIPRLFFVFSGLPVSETGFATFFEMGSERDSDG